MQVNHHDIVVRLHAEQPPVKSLAGALNFTLRVIAALPPDERAGLLAKSAGENLASYKGTLVSVGRVFYLSGELYKILSDIPTTMAPIWDFVGLENPHRYVAVDGAHPEPPAPPEPLPGPPDEEDWPELLLKALDRIGNGVEGLAVPAKSLDERVANLEGNGIKLRWR